MMISIVLLLFFLTDLSFAKSSSSLVERKKTDEHHEILVPLNSLTPLMCDSIFNKHSMTATWYKDGKPVGEVSSHSNYVYKHRHVELAEIPEIGFLIIPNIELKDEGSYWCQVNGQVNGNGGEDRKQSKAYRLRVAFIESFDEDQEPVAHPAIPRLGHTLTIDCPSIDSYPKAVISWKLNDETIDFASGRIEVAQNGSLLIRRYQPGDGGVYACTWSNFAGQTSAEIQLFPPVLYPPLDNGGDAYAPMPGSCSPYFRNGLLWFLVGCLSTSGIVLIYLMAGLVCYRYSRRSTGFAPLQSVFRADPSLAPGFRKVIVPVNTYVSAATAAEPV